MRKRATWAKTRPVREAVEIGRDRGAALAAAAGNIDQRATIVHLDAHTHADDAVTWARSYLTPAGWEAAMLAGWRAFQDRGRVDAWD